MPNQHKTRWDEKAAREDLIHKCYTYLRDNFHKFNDTNKLKVALELVKKSIPTNIEGEMNHKVTMMPAVKIGGKEMELDIGTDATEEEDSNI